MLNRDLLELCTLIALRLCPRRHAPTQRSVNYTYKNSLKVLWVSSRPNTSTKSREPLSCDLSAVCADAHAVWRQDCFI